MPQQQDMRYAPLSLFASAQFQSGTSGGVNKDALVNPTGFPLEIIAIKFQLVPAAGTITGGAVGCRLDYGAEAMTNGFVPLFSFCKAINTIDESTPPGTSPPIGTTNVVNLLYKPTIPIFVPPRGLVSPQFQHFGLTKQRITVKIIYSCRVILDPNYKPKSIALPYITFYKSKVFDPFGVQEYDASTETDLRNPFDQQLNVDRFVGRTSWNNLATADTQFEDGLPDFGERLLTLRMMDSFGEPVVADFTPFGQVFSHMTKSWESSHVLGRNGYYLAFLDKLAPPDPTFADGAYSAQAFISMLGWRKLGVKS